MLLEPLVMSLIIGLLFGGKISSFSKVDIKYIHLVFFVFLLQIVTIYLYGHGVDRDLLIWVYYFTYPVLIGTLLFNHRIKILNLFTLGTVLNFAVILANGGMPVNEFIMVNYLGGTVLESEGSLGVLHIVMGEGSNLKILADIIPVPKPLPSAGMISIGDILMMISVFVFVIQTMITKNTTKV